VILDVLGGQHGLRLRAPSRSYTPAWFYVARRLAVLDGDDGHGADVAGETDVVVASARPWSGGLTTVDDHQSTTMYATSAGSPGLMSLVVLMDSW
jgi:hypothetical protein